MSPHVCYVASYPKSGNTWMRMLLGCYYWRDPGVRVQFDDINAYFLHVVSPQPLSELTEEEVCAIRPAALLHMMRTQSDLRWLLVKTHNANGYVNGLPLFPPIVGEKAIYVARDPRAVASSYADYMGKTVDEAIADLANPALWIASEAGAGHLLRSWSGHVHSWREQERLDVHVVRYEDLCEDAERELGDAVRFLEREPDLDRVREAVEACEFGALRAREVREGFSDASEHQDRFFRKGEAEAWREELSDGQIERIESDHAGEMERLDYHLSAVGVA